MAVGCISVPALGDVFSGVVLSFSRPYRPGDWINLEGGTRTLKGEAKDDGDGAGCRQQALDREILSRSPRRP